MTKIKQAAIRDEDGVLHTLPRPNRHHNIMHDLPVKQGPNMVMGFITDDGIFANRKSAQNQVPDLFPERSGEGILAVLRELEPLITP